ncbi:hypothetical protein D3C72_211630 [compost metagenome]
MRPFLRSAATSLAFAASLWLGAGASAPAAQADEQVSVRLELSTLAPTSIVETFHASASDDWLSGIFPQFSPEDRARIRLMAIERTPRGVLVRIDLKEDVKDPSSLRTPVESALEQLAKSLPRPYSYTMKDAVPPPQPPRFPWAFLGGFAVLLGLGSGLLLLLKRQPRFLAQPRFGGLPMAGVLPAGVGMGGKFLELQSAPCQTMGVMVREMTLAASASRARAEVREVAIAATGDHASAAVVTAALGISLVREGSRVLVVDFLGDESLLSEVLEESDDDSLLESGDLATLRHTGIPDLDLMTALPWPEGEQPLLPRALIANYDWTLLVLPEGRFVAQAATFAVFSGPTSMISAWRTHLAAWRQKAPLLGAILVGVPLPAEVRDRMLARSYFERVRSLEKVTD